MQRDLYKSFKVMSEAERSLRSKNYFQKRKRFISPIVSIIVILTYTKKKKTRNSLYLSVFFLEEYFRPEPDQADWHRPGQDASHGYFRVIGSRLDLRFPTYYIIFSDTEANLEAKYEKKSKQWIRWQRRYSVIAVNFVHK